MRDELLDGILPAQTVYVQAVLAAEHEYRRATRAAWNARQEAIDQALSICLIALKKVPTADED